MSGTFPLRPGYRAQVARIGASGEPVIVIDGVLPSPESLVDHAVDQARFKLAAGPLGGYPGVRAPAPTGYTDHLVAATEPLIRRIFQCPDAARVTADGFLSIVTMRPDSLHVSQRLPHVDTCNPHRFALLHFLCAAPFGGTAFFRHLATGLEQVAPGEHHVFADVRRRELAKLPEPRGFPNAATPGYAETARFEARWNRLLIYRSFSLHSGVIPVDVAHPADPRNGRLTANIFVDYAPGRDT